VGGDGRVPRVLGDALREPVLRLCARPRARPRLAAEDQPRLPITLPALNTGAILLSSCTLERALQEVRSGRPAARPLALTAALGVVFLALQALVWVRLYREGLVPSGGPYASVFYTLTLFHALHVCVGLGAVAWLAARAAHGAARPLSVRLWTMYWHFVGGVWVVLYATVYLL
jgi:heme/copper-type cytochrome/quinol oxidase subunit 3